MQRRTLIATVGAVIGTGIGATAYTSATVDRSATIDVVTDDTGLIGLGTGTSGDLIYQDGNGALAIDLGAGNATGANVNSTFTFGTESDALNSYGFTLTNNDTTARDVTLDYTLANTDPDTNNPNVQFKVYDDTGAAVEVDGTTGDMLSIADESAGYTITGAPAGTAYYIVLVVDTNGLDSTADLSGTLTVSA